MKRIICLIAVLSMLFLTVSCSIFRKDPNSQSSDIGSDTAAVTDAQTEFKAFSTVSPQNYGGHTFNILYPQADNCYTDFKADEINGSIMNDVIYKRNLQVEETFGIKLDVKWQSYTIVNQDLQTQVTAGNTDYDMYGGHRTSLTMSYGGYLYDMYDIPEIDLTQEWWDQDWVKTMSVSDSLYVLIGDISVSCSLFVSSLCFNKQLFDNNGLAYPYELVRNNQWTYDKMYKLIENYTTDLNGDGKMSYDVDQYGLTGWGTEAGYSLFYGSGFSFITKKADDTYTLDVNADLLTSITDKVYDIWIKAGSYFNNTGTAAEHPYPFSIFTNNHALFCDTSLSKIGKFLTDMEADYGIVPQPMYDANQGKYYSYTGYTIPITMVPSNCPDTSRTGTIIEALCTSSYDNVIPDMYEIVTAVRNARDTESSEMIHIIIRTKFFDPAHWYNVTGYGSYSRTMISSKNNNVASMIKSYDRVAQTNLDTIIKAFEDQKNK